MRNEVTRGVRARDMTMLAAALGGAILMGVLSVASLPVMLGRRLFLDPAP